MGGDARVEGPTGTGDGLRSRRGREGEGGPTTGDYDGHTENVERMEETRRRVRSTLINLLVYSG